MATVGRLGGAILARSGEDYFLVGEFKEPCELGRLGFRRLSTLAHRDGAPVAHLCAEAPFAFEGPTLEIPLEGETLARELYDRLVIYRNHSVSERLWHLVLSAQKGSREARWLVETPPEVWQVVREGVLKCL